MDKTLSIPLGVVIERRRIDNPWKDYTWRPVSVFPGAPALDPQGPWTQLRESETATHFHCGTLNLELFRAETDSYGINLVQTPPRIFVILRSNDDPDIPHEHLPFLATASPFEAQNYLDSGEDIVEAVPMPDELIALIQDFVDTHHHEEVFTKRRRKGAKRGDDAFSRRPPVELSPAERAQRRRTDRGQES